MATTAPGSTVAEWPDRLRHDLCAVHGDQSLDGRISCKALFRTSLFLVTVACIANTCSVATRLPGFEAQLDLTTQHSADGIAQLQHQAR